ncbi:cell division protein FtsZ [Mycoplasmopsis californica]|uniref:cell division protein FtsZ n=1 Tax=Mycoplasmopsis californica TaxID=2113 RepID=UPI000EB6814E|nr:cell division protein FtsZ [Mycoplasmopsis californica]BBG41484.1 cell division protein FtsZ [Mycoplasmopsis californica]BBG42077.1 cell division protein FtsZ [Mycoplasmopsis californica]
MSQTENLIKIKVIGVGGAGNNIFSSLVSKELENIDLIVANTDFQVLNNCPVEKKIYLGDSTKGLGTGGDPEIGAQCAKESIDEIEKSIEGADIVVVVAGLGKGTGTGSGPVIAQTAKQKGILTLAMVATPFEQFEGSRVSAIANQGLRQLKDSVNAYMVLSNEKLVQQNIDFPFSQAFKMIDEIVAKCLSTITQIINQPTKINVDFNDFKAILQNGGKIVIGSGKAQGDNKIQSVFANATESANIIDKPQSFSHVIFHCLLDQHSAYSEIIALKNSLIEHFNMDSTIDTRLAIGNYESPDSKDDSLQFSFIATEQEIVQQMNKTEPDDTQTQSESDIDELTRNVAFNNSWTSSDLQTGEKNQNRDKIPNF